MTTRPRQIGWQPSTLWRAWAAFPVWASLALTSVSPLLAQTSPAPAQAGATFRIAGTLLNATTGEPAQRATVSVLDMDNHTVASVTTDAQGLFSIENLTAAKYPLSASKRGYRTAFYDDHDGYNTAIVTGPDQDTTHLIFFLVPDAVLRGVVTADGGDPVEGARVMLFQRPRASWPDRHDLRVGTTTTDDTGAYEFGGLAEGEYLIAVAAQPWYAIHREAPKSKNVKELDVAYPVTYFDSTTSEASATPIAIGKGAREQADIHLHAVPALRIMVNAVRRSDGRLARPELQQVVFGSAVFAESVGFMDALKKGSADFNGMAPGHYELTIGDPPRIVDLDASASSVVEADAGNPMLAVAGTVRLANGEPLPEESHLVLVPQNGTMSHVGQSAAIRNGNFKVAAVAPGTWSVAVDARGKVRPVVGIGTGSTVHAGNTITVRDQELNIVVVVGQGTALIGGMVQKDGKGFGGAMVVLVPREQADLETLARRDQSDSDGSFSLRDVVPGRYTVVAVEDGWNLDWQAPGALARYLPHGTAVTVQDNSEATVHLAGPVMVQPR